MTTFRYDPMPPAPLPFPSGYANTTYDTFRPPVAEAMPEVDELAIVESPSGGEPD